MAENFTITKRIRAEKWGVPDYHGKDGMEMLASCWLKMGFIQYAPESSFFYEDRYVPNGNTIRNILRWCFYIRFWNKPECWGIDFSTCGSFLKISIHKKASIL
jgi:hypothetical protein